MRSVSPWWWGTLLRYLTPKPHLRRRNTWREHYLETKSDTMFGTRVADRNARLAQHFLGASSLRAAPSLTRISIRSADPFPNANPSLTRTFYLVTKSETMCGQGVARKNARSAQHFFGGNPKLVGAPKFGGAPKEQMRKLGCVGGK